MARLEIGDHIPDQDAQDKKYKRQQEPLEHLDLRSVGCCTGTGLATLGAYWTPEVCLRGEAGSVPEAPSRKREVRQANSARRNWLPQFTQVGTSSGVGWTIQPCRVNVGRELPRGRRTVHERIGHVTRGSTSAPDARPPPTTAIDGIPPQARGLPRAPRLKACPAPAPSLSCSRGSHSAGCSKEAPCDVGRWACRRSARLCWLELRT